jgi:hypothetical protein
MNNEIYSKQSNSNLSKIAFCTHVIGFTRQAIKGIIISSYRFISSEGNFNEHTREEVQEIIRNGNFIFENMIEYMNSNWKSFNENKDPYITEKFIILIKFGNFKHNSCIFLFVWDFIQTVLIFTLGRISSEDLIDVESLRNRLEKILDDKFANVIGDILYEDFSCNESCEPISYEEGCSLINVRKG